MAVGKMPRKDRRCREMYLGGRCSGKQLFGPCRPRLLRKPREAPGKVRRRSGLETCPCGVASGDQAVNRRQGLTPVLVLNAGGTGRADLKRLRGSSRLKKEGLGQADVYRPCKSNAVDTEMGRFGPFRERTWPGAGDEVWHV